MLYTNASISPAAAAALCLRAPLSCFLCRNVCSSSRVPIFVCLLLYVLFLSTVPHTIRKVLVCLIRSFFLHVARQARPPEAAQGAENGSSKKKHKKRRDLEENGGGGASSPPPNGGKSKKKKKNKNA